MKIVLALSLLLLSTLFFNSNMAEIHFSGYKIKSNLFWLTSANNFEGLEAGVKGRTVDETASSGSFFAQLFSAFNITIEYRPLISLFPSHRFLSTKLFILNCSFLC